MKKLSVGLFGSNGHQLDPRLPGIEEAEVTAVCGIPEEKTGALEPRPVHYDRLEDLLAHSGLDLVSVCSPLRSGQYEHIKKALIAGKHVYAEKPLVLAARQLDELIGLARLSGVRLRDMSSTSYEFPYAEIREIAATGVLGDIVQVSVQKSYPYADWRPQDEEVDGGLILQVGIHAVRMIEQAALRRVLAVSAVQTRSGNPVRDGGLHMAAHFQMRLEGGAIGSAAVNYLNQPGAGVWGNDELRVFGTRAMMESVQGGGQVHLITAGGKERIHPPASPRPSHFQLFILEILGFPTALLPMETELRALRAALAARESAQKQGVFIDV